MTYKKKLIEVALPLEAINVASAREKSIRHGHPSTLHLWWARRPLAACRAVLFASLVDDPSATPDIFPTDELQEAERQRLFRIIEELVKWENTDNDTVLAAAHAEIVRSTNGAPPAVIDPFCGGGSIPLEAQRLGLEAHGSDLNPVAVLITKALIEIPPRFSNRSPVHPDSRADRLDTGQWTRAHGLADDLRRYGDRMRTLAHERIGHLYPRVSLPPQDGGGEATVIAWLWTRTVKCPNPACGAEMPLARSFGLCNKKGREAFVDPVVDRQAKTVTFKVRTGPGVPQEGTVGRRGARCLVCGTAVPLDHVRVEGQEGRMSARLMAVIAEGTKGRFYLEPTDVQVLAASSAAPTWRPDVPLPHNPRDFKTPNYGMRSFADLFTARQLVALTTFSEMVAEVRAEVLDDAVAAGMPRDGVSLEDGGCGATAYADAVATYLAFAVDRSANYWSSLTPWGGDFIVQTFGRQALPMVWDYAEANPFSDSTGCWAGAIRWIAKCLEIAVPGAGFGRVTQRDAAASIVDVVSPLISTDPPYYDNIGYADLSDYFYVWLRHSLVAVYPQLMSTLLVPKAQELVATPYRFGGDKHKAQVFFEHGLGDAFERMRETHNPDYPLTIYYAFKQAETDDDGQTTASTGWETMLEGLLKAGYSVVGTWPVRSERDQGLKTGMNALASSIVLVCRPRAATAGIATRSEFAGALRRVLPSALRLLQHGNIAPVDLAQAAIGPGMGVFSEYAKVVETDGSGMPVRAALALINQVLDEVLSEQDSEYDPATRWALTWFEQQGFSDGPYGTAEVLAKAKAIALSALADDGFIESHGGRVRLLRREELADDWNPATDKMLTVWEATQHTVRMLERDGESGAARVLAQVGPGYAEIARDLAYRLFAVCEKKGWSKEALPFNALVIAWPEIVRLAASGAVATGPAQSKMEM